MLIKNKIISLINEFDELSIKEMVDFLDVSKQAIHYAVNQLLDEGKIIRFGRTPKTTYKNSKGEYVQPFKSLQVEDGISEYDFEFFQITETGDIFKGVTAFDYWCQQRDLPFNITLKEYHKTLKKYQPYYSSGIINGTQKLNNTLEFPHIHLNQLYYLDFYAIERFGKTPLGTLLHFAKQGQSKILMRMIIEKIKPIVSSFINNKKFDSVAFIPPTIKREVQFMKYLENGLSLNLPLVKIEKISGLIPVPQKSLHRIKERIRNAEITFTVKDTDRYSHLLLIDDAVGSGATLNQVAGKLLKKGIAKKVSAVAVVGSYKGFDVITDV